MKVIITFFIIVIVLQSLKLLVKQKFGPAAAYQISQIFRVHYDELNPVKECAVGFHRKLCQYSGLVDFRVLQKSPESVIVRDVQLPTEQIVNSKSRSDTHILSRRFKFQRASAEGRNVEPRLESSQWVNDGRRHALPTTLCIFQPKVFAGIRYFLIFQTNFARVKNLAAAK